MMCSKIVHSTDKSETFLSKTVTKRIEMALFAYERYYVES